EDISGYGFPAVVSNYRPGRIQAFRQVIKSLNIVALRKTLRQIRDAPRLIQRNPSDDAGVTAVTVQNLHPLAGYPLDRLCGVAIGAGHLLPDEQADTVGPVKVARIFNLLVL